MISNDFKKRFKSVLFYFLELPLTYLLIIFGFFLEMIIELPFILVLMIDKVSQRKA